MIKKHVKRATKLILSPYFINGALALFIFMNITVLYSFSFIHSATIVEQTYAVGFDATSIAGCKLWLDAQDPATLVVTASPDVDQWNDKCGNALDLSQATVASKPHTNGDINGYNAITFDGVDDYLKNTISSKLSGSSGYIFVVTKFPSTITPNGSFLTSAWEGGGTKWFATAHNASSPTSGSVGQRNADTQDTVHDGTTTMAASSSNILMIGSDGSSYHFRTNGVTGSNVIDSGLDGGNWFANTYSRSNIVLGVLQRSIFTGWFKGDIGEVVVYDNVILTQQQIESIEAGLAAKWGITITSPNTAPTAASITASQVLDGSETVSLSFTMDDADDDDTLEALVEYDVGAGYQKATLSEVDIDTSATFGDPKVTNAETYQVGGATGYITTSSGANTVTTIWNAGVDEPGIDVADATIRITPHDGTIAGTPVVSSDFAVDLVGPNTPTNTLPTNGAVSQYVTPMLTASAFSEAGGDTHTASQWQITTTSGDYATPIFDSGTDTGNLTSIYSSILNINTKYYWHVRYRDSDNVWSSYSTETSFTTGSSGVTTQTVSNISLVINDNAQCTSSNTVVVTVGATNAVDVLISESPLFINSNWITFTGLTMQVNYTFTDITPAEKSIYAKFRSSTLNQSNVVSDSIFLLTKEQCSTITPTIDTTIEVPSVPTGTTTTTPVVSGNTNAAIVNIESAVASIRQTSAQFETELMTIESSLETLRVALNVAPSTKTADIEQIFGVRPGDYVRGESSSTVFLISKDILGNLVKHPVINLLTFYTYQPSVLIVKQVADTTLQFFDFGKSVLPKSQVVLLKFRSQNQVYVIQQNPKDPYSPILMEITDPQLAKEALGENWQDYIVDLDDAFYGRFVIDGPVTSSSQITKSTMKTYQELQNMVNASK